MAIMALVSRVGSGQCIHLSATGSLTRPDTHTQGTGVWSWIKMKRDKKEGEEDDDGSGPNAGAAGCVLRGIYSSIQNRRPRLSSHHTPQSPIHSRKSGGPGGGAGGRPTATGASGGIKKPPSSSR